MGDFLHATYQLIKKYHWAAIGALLLTLALLVNSIRSITFDDDISSLIPATEKTIKTQKVLKNIAFTDKIIVNIKKGKQGSTNDLTAYATEFLDSLETSYGDQIKTIQGRIGQNDLPNSLQLVYDNLPLFLDAQDYVTIKNKLTPDSIAQATKNNYHQLVSPTGLVAKKTILKDPLGLTFIALKKFQKMGFGDDFTMQNNFLVAKNEENLLLFITPKFGSGETNKNIPFSEALYRIQNKLNTKYQLKAQSEYFGAALSAVSNAAQIKHDIQFTVSIAMSLLIVFLIFFYRKLIVPLILFTPTLFGGLLAIAILCLIRAKISAISLGIGSILLGVTLDYGLHILTHIRNDNSIKNLYKEVAPSILVSSATTASAFLCLLFLKSQALQDLGIFAAISVLGAAIFALLFIPLVYKNKNAIELKPTFLDHFAKIDWHKNKIAISILAILSVVSIFTYNRVYFDQDLAKLNYETDALKEARNRLESLTDLGANSVYISTFNTDFEKALQQNDSLVLALNKFKQANKIISYSSIHSFLKSNKTQQQQLANWQQFWSESKIDSVKKQLIQNGATYGFKENTHAPFYKQLKAKHSNLNLASFNTISAFPVNDYIVSNKNETTITTLVKVTDAQLPGLLNAFKDTKNTLAINRKQVNETFLGHLKSDFNTLLGYSLIVVVLILLLFYQSLTLTIITAIPIFLTWFLTVGCMGLFHIDFNIFNIIICSFIFGLGVDYSIFITNGLLIEYRTGEKVLPTNKTAILLSVITTIAGVGVLIFAKHPVLYTIAIVALIGIFCAVFVSFTLQPLLFKLFIGNTHKRPITPRYLIHSLLSFAYFDLGGLLLSIYSWFALKIDPKARDKKQIGVHKVTSKLMKSVLYTNPFLKKNINNPLNENFDKPALLIANHASFLDILSIGLLNPKLIYLVKDHVYNSKVMGSAAKLTGAYPVSGGIEFGEAYLRQKLAQGFSIVAFPEGSRSTTNKIHRFHKGAFYLAEQLNLDILPVILHGGSEVSPKGSFIIRDGSLTTSFLPRITPDDSRFSTDYSKRAKEIGAYFRSEFRKFRTQIEDETYWHSFILENYKFKGNAIYKTVKNDLVANKKEYKELLTRIGQKETIAHISNDYGQLDILISLDAIDRKIYSYLENKEASLLLKNNYLTHQYSNIRVADSLIELTNSKPSVLILNSSATISEEVNTLINNATTLVLLKQSITTQIPNHFFVTHQNDTFILLTKQTKN